MVVKGMAGYEGLMFCAMFYPVTDLGLTGHPPREQSITVHPGRDEK